jgi:hypothetical protein
MRRCQKSQKMGNVRMMCCSTVGKEVDVDEGVAEPRLERSDTKPLQKTDSFASTASSKTTLQPCLGRPVGFANVSTGAAQNVTYPVMLHPYAVQNIGLSS